MNHSSVYRTLLPLVETFATDRNLPLARGGKAFEVPVSGPWMRTTYEPSVTSAHNVALGGRQTRVDAGLAVAIYIPVDEDDPDDSALDLADQLVESFENKTLQASGRAVRLLAATVSRQGVAEDHPGYVLFTVGIPAQWDRQR